MSYTKNPLVLSTIYDVYKLKKTASKICKSDAISIVHCRSYIAALAGLSVKEHFGARFIFDMRGFWADERVDGNLWNLKNPLYRIVYNFFKRKEIEFLTQADQVISLTHAGSNEMNTWQNSEKFGKVSIIPCSVDTKEFNPEITVDVKKIIYV